MFDRESTSWAPDRKVVAVAWRDWLRRVVPRGAAFVELHYGGNVPALPSTALRHLADALYRATVIADAWGPVVAVPFLDRTPVEGRLHFHLFVAGIPTWALEACWTRGESLVSRGNGRRARLYVADKEARDDDAGDAGGGFIGVWTAKSIVERAVLGALEAAGGPQTAFQVGLRLAAEHDGRTRWPDAAMLGKTLRRLERDGAIKWNGERRRSA